MTDRMHTASSETQLLAHALEKLRIRDGLTRSRLEDSSHSSEAAQLLRLAAVQRYAALNDLDPIGAALNVVKECVRDSLQGSHRIVADAILGLGTFSEIYASHGIEPRVISALQSDSLGRRRKALLAHWGHLQDALGLPVDASVSDRALRGTLESAVFRELAEHLIGREAHSFQAKSIGVPSVINHSSGRRSRVIVLGGAVMDVTFRTRVLPQNQTSVKALGFSLAPGGKGLWQAVAAAKLGLDVALVAAVADDHFGREIDSYLRSHGIDTSLLKVIKDAHTPFTGVIEFVRGDSLALTWPNETEISLSAQDIDELRGDFADCDAVLITFEIPRETLEHTLSLINKLDEPRPIVIVTAGQPYNAAISAQAFSRIDYLVAHEWELGPLASADRESFAVETAAQRLLALGVETLCIPNLKGCTVYSEAFAKYAVPIFQSTYKELLQLETPFVQHLQRNCWMTGNSRKKLLYGRQQPWLPQSPIIRCLIRCLTEILSINFFSDSGTLLF
jgi:ribokinase